MCIRDSSMSLYCFEDSSRSSVPVWTLLLTTDPENFRGIDYHVLKEIKETRIGEVFFCNTIIF